VFGAVGVQQRVPGLLEVYRGRRDVRDHHRLAVSAQRVLEEPRQLAVSVVDVALAALVRCGRKCVTLIADSMGFLFLFYKCLK